MGDLQELRRLARQCAQLATETGDDRIIVALERLGRALEVSVQKLEQAAKDWDRSKP
jgi:hypothetical protein